jgi:hypothetical protein
VQAVEDSPDAAGGLPLEPGPLVGSDDEDGELPRLHVQLGRGSQRSAELLYRAPDRGGEQHQREVAQQPPLGVRERDESLPTAQVKRHP